MDFDPFEPGALKAAFKQSPPDERADMLAEALQPMAKGLRGINFVVDLVNIDPSGFFSGLTAALLENPGNLTAGRARIWYYIRNGRWQDAERVHAALGPYWPNHPDLVAERLRLSIVGTGVAPAREAFEKYSKHLRAAGVGSYRLQTVESLPLAEVKALVGSLQAAGAVALRDLLTRPDETVPHALKLSEWRALWQFSEMVLGARSIALVGNAATLTGAGRGAEIDAHDVVIRCNFPQIKAYARDVGSRTSVMFLNESMRATLLRRRQEFPEFNDAPVIGLHPEPHFGLPTDPVFADVEGVGTLPPAVRRLISDVCYSRATTGLLGICLLAFVFNKKVKLFGFDFFSNVARPHYYGHQVGAWLGHEVHYERFFVTEFLPQTLPGLVEFV